MDKVINDPMAMIFSTIQSPIGDEVRVETKVIEQTIEIKCSTIEEILQKEGEGIN